MKQNALTLVSSIEDSKIENLRTILKNHKTDLQAALANVGTIHYARWVIVDGETIDGDIIPTQLVFASNFDGEIEAHIKGLIEKLGDKLDLIYNNANGYTPSNKLLFFTNSKIKEAAFYKGCPGRSVQEIASEKALHQELSNLIQAGDWQGKCPVEVQRELRESIFANPDFQWAKQPEAVPGIKYLSLVLFGLLLLILSPFIILWVIYIQLFFERKDVPLNLTPNQLDDKKIELMEKDEDFGFQNQFSQIINMKPGRSRAITVGGLYIFTNSLVNFLFVKGKLMGIPTIHFARWVQLDDKKRMLFFSNFDGSWTQYLGDFIDKSGWGLTGIFSNTKGFPRAWFLFFGGAYKERQFLAWARNTQIQTQVWYAADTSQSIKNVNNNTAIRNDLGKNLNKKNAQIFLARI